MSVVKTVKERKTLLHALEQDSKNKAKWWEHKHAILVEWLNTSPEELTVEGARELIASQLERGNQHTHLRFKCWKHIVIELAALLEDDGSGQMSGRRKSSNNLILPPEEDVPEKEPQEVSPGGDQSHALSHTEGAEDSTEDVDINGLSFVERQALWLKRRQKSLTNKAQTLMEQEKNNATFSPKINLSQSSMRPSQVAAVEKKLEHAVEEAERHRRRVSVARELEARKRVEREEQRQRDREQHMLSANAPAEPPTMGKKRGSRVRVKGDDTTDPSGKGRRATDPARHHAVQFNTEQPAEGLFQSDGSDSGDTDDGGAALSPGRSVAAGDQPEVEAEADPESQPQPAPEPVDLGPPFVAGSFFTKVDDRQKGHYKVRDAGGFLLTSMYKRKDRVTRTAGVSLLVGKLEQPPHEEKVVSAIFDLELFSEQKAAAWWEVNGHRFEDQRSREERDEQDRKTIEQDANREEFARRFSAPAHIMSGAPVLMTATA